LQNALCALEEVASPSQQMTSAAKAYRLTACEKVLAAVP